MRSEDVSWNSGREVASELLLVRAAERINEGGAGFVLNSLILDIHYPFSVSIPKVTLVRGAEMNVELGEWVLNFVRINTSRQARDQLLDLVGV